MLEIDIFFQGEPFPFPGNDSLSVQGIKSVLSLYEAKIHLAPAHL